MKNKKWYSRFSFVLLIPKNVLSFDNKIKDDEISSNNLEGGFRGFLENVGRVWNREIVA